MKAFLPTHTLPLNEQNEMNPLQHSCQSLATHSHRQMSEATFIDAIQSLGKLVQEPAAVMPAVNAPNLRTLSSSQPDKLDSLSCSLLQMLQKPSSTPIADVPLQSTDASSMSFPSDVPTFHPDQMPSSTPPLSSAPSVPSPSLPHKRKSSPPAGRFRKSHEDKWSQRVDELRHFRRQHGHCLVPYSYPPNPQLGCWVKRQRRQHKLLTEGKTSTMTAERVRLLEDVGFVWDSHDASWEEKLNDLRLYRSCYGNCLVPSTFKKNPQLAVWVKCQRRQHKLFWEGKPSSMTVERIARLEKEGFCWEVRPCKNKETSVAEQSQECNADDFRWLYEVVSLL